MAYTQNEKSTGLDALTALAAGDLFIVGDVSDSGRAKAITRTNLITDLTSAGTGIQTGIQFEDEAGANLGTSGTVDEFEITGSVTGVRAGNKVTYTITPGSVANASTTVNGIVQEATQSEVNAGTGTGTTGARLFINPSTLGAAILAYITAAVSTYRALFLKYTVNADETVFDWHTTEISAPENVTNGKWKTLTLTANAITPFGNATLLTSATGGVTTIVAAVKIPNFTTSGSLQWDENTSFRVKTESGVEPCLIAKPAEFTFIGVGTAIDASFGDTTVNARRIGFAFNQERMYAIVSASGTRTVTDIGAYAAQTKALYEIVYDTGVNAKFYIDGVLMTTISTTLPTGAQDMQVGFSSSADVPNAPSGTSIMAGNIILSIKQ